jgi:hypothetical protein
MLRVVCLATCNLAAGLRTQGRLYGSSRVVGSLTVKCKNTTASRHAPTCVLV